MSYHIYHHGSFKIVRCNLNDGLVVAFEDLSSVSREEGRKTFRLGKNEFLAQGERNPNETPHETPNETTKNEV